MSTETGELLDSIMYLCKNMSSTHPNYPVFNPAYEKYLLIPIKNGIVVSCADPVPKRTQEEDSVNVNQSPIAGFGYGPVSNPTQAEDSVNVNQSPIVGFGYDPMINGNQEEDSVNVNQSPIAGFGYGPVSNPTQEEDSVNVNQIPIAGFGYDPMINGKQEEDSDNVNQSTIAGFGYGPIINGNQEEDSVNVNQSPIAGFGYGPMINGNQEEDSVNVNQSPIAGFGYGPMINGNQEEDSGNVNQSPIAGFGYGPMINGNQEEDSVNVNQSPIAGFGYGPIINGNQEEDSVNVNQSPIAGFGYGPMINGNQEEDSVNVNQSPIAGFGYDPMINGKQEEDSVNVNQSPIAGFGYDPMINGKQEEDSVNVNQSPIAGFGYGPIINGNQEEDSVNVNQSPIAGFGYGPMINGNQEEDSVNVNQSPIAGFGYGPIINGNQEEDSVNVNQSSIAGFGYDPMINGNQEEDSVNVNQSPIAGFGYAPGSNPTQEEDSVNVNQGPIAGFSYDSMINGNQDEDSVNVNQSPIAAFGADPMINGNQEEDSVNVNQSPIAGFGYGPVSNPTQEEDLVNVKQSPIAGFGYDSMINGNQEEYLINVNQSPFAGFGYGRVFNPTQEEDSVNVNQSPIAGFGYYSMINGNQEEYSVNVNQSPIAPGSNPTQEEDSVNVNQSPIAEFGADPMINGNQEEDSVNVNQSPIAGFGYGPMINGNQEEDSSDGNRYQFTESDDDIVIVPSCFLRLVDGNDYAIADLADDQFSNLNVEDSGVGNENINADSVDVPGFIRTYAEDSDNVNVNENADSCDDSGFNRTFAEDSDNVNENENADSDTQKKKCDDPGFNRTTAEDSDNVNENENELSDEDFSEDEMAEIEIALKINTRCIIDPNDEVSHSDFEVLKYIGKGSFGQVFLVRKIGGVDNRKLYAMKVLQRHAALDNFQTANNIKIEREILENIRGQPFLIKMHYAFQTDTNLNFVMDFVAGGDLLEHLSRKNEIKENFNEDQVRLFIAETVTAIETLHRLHIMYRDLKLENLLLDAGGHIVITDFGLSKQLKSRRGRTNSICGTPEYMAPEIVSKQSYNLTVDWWGIGILVYELLTSATPFDLYESTKEMSHRIINEDPPIRSELKCQIVAEFVTNLLEKNPMKRLGARGADEVKNHEFLSNINWNDLIKKQIKPPYVPVVKDELDVENFRKSFLDRPNVISSGPKVYNTETFFQGFAYVAPEIMKANRYYRKINKKDNEKILRPAVPDGPTSEAFLEFMSQNPKFFNKYKFVDPIPIGNFGAYSLCLKCENIKTKKIYACKILNTLPTTIYEIEKLIECRNHPKIVNFFDHVREKHLTFIAMEWLSGESVFERCANKGSYSQKQIYLIFTQILTAIEHIHSKGIAHCNLNLQNFMFISCDSWYLKLIDFGSAIYVDDKQYEKSLKPTFTVECAAPEIIQFYEQELQIIENTIDNAAAAAATADTTNNYKCLKESDLWSIGIILYRLMCNEYPFYSKPYSYEIIKEQILSAEIVDNCYSDKRKFNLEINENAKLLIQQLLKINPAERLTIIGIQQNKWYKKANAFNQSYSEQIDPTVTVSSERLGAEQKLRNTSENNDKFMCNTETTIDTRNSSIFPIATASKFFDDNKNRIKRKKKKSKVCISQQPQLVENPFYKFKILDAHESVRRSSRIPMQTDFYRASLRKSTKKRPSDKQNSHGCKKKRIIDCAEKFYGFPSHNDSVFYEPIDNDPECFYGFNAPYEFDRIKYYSFHYNQISDI